MAGTCRVAAAQRLAPWRGDDRPFARKAALSERAPTSVAEQAAQTSIDLADERWPRKVKDAAKTSYMPSVFRFPRKRTNATRRLARGLSGRTRYSRLFRDGPTLQPWELPDMSTQPSRDLNLAPPC